MLLPELYELWTLRTLKLVYENIVFINRLWYRAIEVLLKQTNKKMDPQRIQEIMFAVGATKVSTVFLPPFKEVR